jgi:hypothetical protein
MKGPRPHLKIIWSDNDASLLSPEFLQRKNNILERKRIRKHKDSLNKTSNSKISLEKLTCL